MLIKVTVWVLELGMYSGHCVGGVYGSVESAIADNPIREGASRGSHEPGWTQIGPLAWTNHCDFEDAATVTGYDVEIGEKPRNV